MKGAAVAERPRRFGVALALSVILSPVPGAAVTIADDTFLDSDWSPVEVLDTSGAATFSAFQQTTGGFPDAFRQTTHSVPGGTQSIILDHVFEGAQYDPAVDGTIASIDLSLDVRFIGGSTGTSQVGHQLILIQGGTHYNALGTQAVALGPGNGAPGAWSSHAFSGLTASNFTRLFGGGPLAPDFSANGGPIQFGYLTLNTSLSIAIATTSGVDNWTVTIHPVPAPPAGLLLGLGALAVWRRRRVASC